MNEYLHKLKHKLMRTEGLEGDALTQRLAGKDWPNNGAITMIGEKRLDNIYDCLENVISNKIPGDFIECGVWKGGACVYAKAVINQLKSDKKVFVADSFCGFPKPKFNWDKGANFLDSKELKVSEDEVKLNFKKYECLDDNVIFVKGYFEDTLPKLNETFSIIRADGDLFESTIDILVNLYQQLSIGGFMIIDDFSLKCCQEAVRQYLQQNHLEVDMKVIDYTGIYWKKEK